MAVKYYFENEDLEGNVYVGSFSNPAYVGSSIELEGSFTMQKDLSGDVFQPVQAKSCRVNILATKARPLEDIYNEDDRYWYFQLTKNSNVMFNGYASTIDMEQPFTAEEWKLEFDCLDHLSYLDEFGYYDAAGLPYSGNDTVLNIMLKCLEKGFNLTGEELGIRLQHYLTNDGSDVFTSMYLNQDQFYDQDGEADDCFTILEDILKSLGCFIEQNENFFWVTPVFMFAGTVSSDIAYLQYESDGTPDGSHVLSPSTDDKRIGSDIYDVPTYHINNNQAFYKKKFYNTFRIRHDFIYAPQLLLNGDLEQSGGATPDWTMGADADANGSTVEIDGVELVTESAEMLYSTEVSVKEGDILDLIIDVEYVDDPTETYYQLLLTDTLSGDDYSFAITIQADNSANTAANWYDLPVSPLLQDKIKINFLSEGLYVHEITTLAIPEDGNLQFIAWNPVYGNAYSAPTSKSILESVTLKAKEQTLEAEEYTLSRTDKDTGSVPDVYDIRFNTSDRSILYNVFRDSSNIPIDHLDNLSTSDEISLLESVCRDHILMFSKNYNIFRGDVANNNGMTAKSIDTLGDNYIVTRESKDLTRNISQMELTQVDVSGTAPLAGELRRIYKNPIKPKIK